MCWTSESGTERWLWEHILANKDQAWITQEKPDFGTQVILTAIIFMCAFCEILSFYDSNLPAFFSISPDPSSIHSGLEKN